MKATLRIAIVGYGTAGQALAVALGVTSVVGHPLVKLVLIGLLWAFLHHLCAGIRFLFLDIHKGLELETARATAKATLVVSIALTLLIGGVLW